MEGGITTQTPVSRRLVQLVDICLGCAQLNCSAQERTLPRSYLAESAESSVQSRPLHGILTHCDRIVIVRQSKPVACMDAAMVSQHVLYR